MAAGRVGYEHHYDFSVDDEIVSRITHEVRPRKKTFFVEIKASFIMRRTDGGDDIIIDSETYGIPFISDNANNSTAVYLDMFLTERLIEYWMTAEEVNRFNLEALAFLRQTAANPSRSSNPLVPVRANIEVCTVQQESEPVESVMERAIRAGKLIPLDISHHWVSGPTPKSFRNYPLRWSLRELARIRVEDRDQGLAMMEVCGICKRAPATGAQISIIPACRHAFHSRCIVVWLVHKNLCPVCHSPAYHRKFGASLIIPTPP